MMKSDIIVEILKTRKKKTDIRIQEQTESHRSKSRQRSEVIPKERKPSGHVPSRLELLGVIRHRIHLQVPQKIVRVDGGPRLHEEQGVAPEGGLVDGPGGRGQAQGLDEGRRQARGLPGPLGLAVRRHEGVGEEPEAFVELQGGIWKREVRGGGPEGGKRGDL